MTSDWKRTALAATGALAIGAATGRLLLDSMNDADQALLDVLSAHADPEPDRQESAGPLPNGLVLVVLDGLGEEVFSEVVRPTNLAHPTWKAVVDVGTPSLSRPVYHVLLTGVPQAVSGIRNNAHVGRSRADDLATEVRAGGAGVGFALEGVPWFHDLFGEERDAYEHVRHERPLDALVGKLDGTSHPGWNRFGAMGRIVHGAPKFAILHYTAIDHAGHDHGARSPQYRAAAQEAVESVMEIRDTWSRSPEGARTIWMLGSDHGHLTRGGHGGPEPEVRRTLWHAYWPAPAPTPIDLPDPVDADRLAATFAAILEIPPPREALGEPLPLPDRPVRASAASPARRTAVASALAESTHRAHLGALARAATVLTAAIALAILQIRRHKGKALAGALLPTVLACLAFYLLGPGTTLSAIRTQLGFLTHSTAAMAAGAALAYPFARRLGASSRDIFLTAAAFPLAALAITAASMGHSRLPDSLLLLFPATGILPWGIAAGTLVAWTLHKRRKAAG